MKRNCLIATLLAAASANAAPVTLFDTLGPSNLSNSAISVALLGDGNIRGDGGLSVAIPFTVTQTVSFTEVAIAATHCGTRLILPGSGTRPEHKRDCDRHSHEYRRTARRRTHDDEHTESAGPMDGRANYNRVRLARLHADPDSGSVLGFSLRTRPALGCDQR
jgi:hypothetical protein